jgi:hypothetical protein
MVDVQCLNPVTCPGGNCPGCQNGKIWCQDPRCDPQCPNCFYDQQAERYGFVTIMIIILALLLIILVILITYGHQVMYYYVPNQQLESKGYLVPPGPAIYY